MSDGGWGAARHFPADMARVPAAVNNLQSHALLGYYLEGWAQWFR